MTQTGLPDVELTAPLYHYVVCRSDLSGGTLLAQVIHAAGESGAGVGANTGALLKDDVRAVALQATREQLETLVQSTLHRSDIQLFCIRETEGPLAGVLTAVGCLLPREAGKKLLGHLRPWGAKV